MFEWDEEKRKSNLIKHGLDFQDAGLVYFASFKVTYDISYPEELRHMDVALAESAGKVFALIYTFRGENVRIISYRPASDSERKRYDKSKFNETKFN